MSDDTHSLPRLEALPLLATLKGSSEGLPTQKNHQRRQLSVKHFSFYQNILCGKDRFSQTRRCCHNHHFAAHTSAALRRPSAARAAKHDSEDTASTGREPSAGMTPASPPPQFFCPKCIWGHIFKLFSAAPRARERPPARGTTRMGVCAFDKNSRSCKASHLGRAWKTTRQPHNLVTISRLP